MVKYKLTKEEQELHIVISAADDHAIVSCSWPALKEKIMALCRQYPNHYCLVDQNNVELRVEVRPWKLTVGLKNHVP